MSWTSPDGTIQKVILVEGIWGTKPADDSECKILLLNCSNALDKYNKTVVRIGDNDGDIGRALDICLMSMHEKERAKFTVKSDNEVISFILEIEEMKFNGFIYEWDAKKRYNLTEYHKKKGVELFKDGQNRDAAFRFTKALKLISSIPIDVEVTPVKVDGIDIEDINKLKCNLYNNLSSCYFRKQCFSMVIDICKEIFKYDRDHIKALYKIGIAYKNDRDFENANKALTRVLDIEPDNKAASDHLQIVKLELRKAEIKFNNMVKKMFQ